MERFVTSPCLSRCGATRHPNLSRSKSALSKVHHRTTSSSQTRSSSGSNTSCPAAAVSQGLCKKCGRRHSVLKRSSSSSSLSHRRTSIRSQSGRSAHSELSSHNCGHSRCFNHATTSVSELPSNFSISVNISEFDNPDYRGDVFNMKIVKTAQQRARLQGQKVRKPLVLSPGLSKVVLRWVRRSRMYDEQNHLESCLRVIDVAAEMLEAFVASGLSKKWSIVINKPRAIECLGSACKSRFQFFLAESYVPDHTKFNSNSGWSMPSSASHNHVLQALSHFSYMWSRGKMLLCNLKGSVDKNSRVITICDPAIVSSRAGQYGCTDIGRSGIQRFFQWHECNSLCSHWPVAPWTG